MARTNKKNFKTIGISEQKLRNINFFMIIAILIFIFYPPFVRGLYFEEEQFIAAINIFSIFGLLMIYKYLKKENLVISTKLELSSILFIMVYSIPILANLIGVGGAVSIRAAKIELLKYIIYFCTFYIISSLFSEYKYRIALLWTIVSSTIGLCIIGFDGGTGEYITKIFNRIFELLGMSIKFFDTFISNRIYSTLQYPNALAAYLMAVFFIAVGLSIMSKNMYAKLVAAASGFFIFITFFYTQSRGAQIIFPIIFILFIILMPKGYKTTAFTYAMSPIIAFLMVFVLGFHKSMQNPSQNSFKIWSFIVIGSLISALIAFLSTYIKKYLEKISAKVYIIVGIAIVLSGICIVLVALNTSMPLELRGNENFNKGIVLKPKTEYNLVFKVDTINAKDSNIPYKINITSKRLKDIISNKDQLVLSYEGKKNIGSKAVEIVFKVPDQSEIIYINFINTQKDGNVLFKDTKIQELSNLNNTKKVILKYKYVPGSIASNFDNMFLSRSSVERSIFYKDAMKMAKDRWLIGAGGGGWQFIYSSYQSFLYSSTQAHSYFFQVLIECGILGIIVFSFFLISIILLLIKYYFENKKEDSQRDINERVLIAIIFSSIIALIAHSSIDFDLSLSSVYLLLWELVALLNISIKDRLKKVEFLKKIKLHPAVGLVIIIIIMIFPISYRIATGYYKSAIKSTYQSSDTIKKLETATFLDSKNSRLNLRYVEVLMKKQDFNEQNLQKIKDTLKKLKNIAGYNLEDISKVGLYYMTIGDIENGLYAFERATALCPFRDVLWQQKANAYTSAISYYLDKNNVNLAKKYSEDCLNSIKQATEFNKNNMNPFKFNIKTDEMLEKVLFIKNNTQNKSSFENLVFNGVYNMDIDSDGILDQWEAPDNKLKFNYKDSYILVNINEPTVINTRDLTLEPSKKYMVSLETDNTKNAVIKFKVTGKKELSGNLELSGGAYNAVFETPKDFEVLNNKLSLYFTDRTAIKNIIIKKLL